MIDSLVDTALDRSVVLGYSKIGYDIRRRLGDWPADPPRMDHAVALVTGASSGLGKATAAGLARLGADVRVLTRDQKRSDDLAYELATETGGSVTGVACNVSDLHSLHEFTERFLAEEKRLDVVVNNAGVMPERRTESDDGVELTFATHVLGPWVLTDRFKELMQQTGAARVINVSSGGMYAQKLPIDDLQSERGEYKKAQVYAKTKRAQLIITEQWAAELAGTGVVVHAMHPGWAATAGVTDALPGFDKVVGPILRDADQGADTSVWLAGSPDALSSTGKFWQDRHPRPDHYLPFTRESPEDRRRLWAECQRLAQLPAAARAT